MPFSRRGRIAALISLASVLLYFLSIPTLSAPPPVDLPGEAEGTKRRFDNLREKIEKLRARPDEKQWGQVIEELQNIVQTAGNDLVPVSDAHCVRARRLCHLYIASLPPDALGLYRRRVDGRAKEWLEQGRKARDARLLRRVVDEAFCSRPAEAALDLLGDLAFERGDFAEAQRWWRFLAAPVGERESRREGAKGILASLRYPDPRGDAARVRAKQLLARWFAGRTDPAEWQRALAQFRGVYARAEGHLAGAKGVYWKRLQAVVEKEGGPPALAREPAGWTTFAGGATRNRVLPAKGTAPEDIGRLCRYGHSWRFPLDGPHTDGKGNFPPEVPEAVLSPSRLRRSLAFHPVIAGRQVLVADTRFVTAYDIDTGERKVWFDVSQLPGGFRPDLKLPAPADLSFTLTVAGDCVLARLGAAEVRSNRDEQKRAKEGATFLVCLNLDPKKGQERLRWHVTPDRARHAAAFEGTAVAHNGRAYVAVTRFAANKEITAVHCYPLDAADTPAPLWKQDVCSTREPATEETRRRHHLLTVAGPNVVYCSHTGAIVALDAATGHRSWAVRYPRRAAPEAGTPRDLAPCVFAGGRLFIAPADSDHLLCLDPLTGRTLWQRDGVEAVQLLGVGQGRLIFTTMTPRPGLRAVGAEDGSDRGGWFASGAGDNAVHTLGRGLLAGDLVYWPTVGGSDLPDRPRRPVYVLTQKDGQQPADPTQLHTLPGGNMAFAGGVLAVADERHLHVFVPAATRLKEREEAAKRQPDSARAHFRLGAAQSDAGQFVQAEESFRTSERLAGAASNPDVEHLPDLARRERYHALLRLADQARGRGDWNGAADALRRAAGPAFPAPARLEALAVLNDLWMARGETARATRPAESVLRDPALCRAHLPDSAGRPQSGGRWALDRLERITVDTLIGGLNLDEHAWPLSVLGQLAAEMIAYCHPPGADTLPALDLPLKRAWHVTLPAGERFLPPHGPDHTATRLFSVRRARDGGSALCCRDVLTGKVLWERELPIEVRWIGHRAGFVHAGGPEAVVCLAESDGRRLWDYYSPAHSGGPPALGAFHLSASRVYFLQGHKRLFALDSRTGNVLWTRWAPGSFVWPPEQSGRFADYRVSGRRVRSSAPRMVLDARTGESLDEGASDPPDVIVRRDPLTGNVLWQHELSRKTTLSGEPWRVISLPACESVWQSLLIVPRNYGTTLERLDAGKSAWPRPVVFPSANVWGPGISHDAEACYLAHQGELTALSLHDGKRLWSEKLSGPDGRWKTVRAGEYVVAFPVGAGRRAGTVPWTFGAVQWCLALPPEAAPGAGFPVVCRDARTGKMVQRVNVEAGTVLDCRLQIADFGLKDTSSGPAVALTPGGMVIVIGRRAWGLKEF